MIKTSSGVVQMFEKRVLQWISDSTFPIPPLSILPLYTLSHVPMSISLFSSSVISSNARGEFFLEGDDLPLKLLARLERVLSTDDLPELRSPVSKRSLLLLGEPRSLSFREELDDECEIVLPF